MSPNTSFPLFIAYNAGILCRRYAQLLLLLLTISVHRALSDLTYDLGDYQVECPDSWINVDANCFLVVDQNVHSWEEVSAGFLK